MTDATAPCRRRSVLFVGALALGGLPAALGSGADLVCIDLEDAVPPGRKAEGRRAALDAVRAAAVPPGVQLVARINALRSLDGIADIAALLDAPGALGVLLLPKVETDDEVRWAAALAAEARSTLDLYAIIETPDGLEEVAGALRRDFRLLAPDLRGHGESGTPRGEGATRTRGCGPTTSPPYSQRSGRAPPSWWRGPSPGACWSATSGATGRRGARRSTWSPPPRSPTRASWATGTGR